MFEVELEPVKDYHVNKKHKVSFLTGQVCPLFLIRESESLSVLVFALLFLEYLTGCTFQTLLASNNNKNDSPLKHVVLENDYETAGVQSIAPNNAAVSFYCFCVTA